MTTRDLEKRISDYAEFLNSNPGRPHDWLEAAIYIEDSFGLRLTDDEITPENLGSAEAISRFLGAKAAR